MGAAATAGSPNALTAGTAKSQLDELLGHINDHENDASSAHAASDISYAGGGNWLGGRTNPATTVEAQLDKIITDLAAQTASDLHKLAPVLEGTTVKAPVAIIYDYDSIWALRIQPGYAGNTYHGAMDRVYTALFRAGINVDFIAPTDDLSRYGAVFAPDLYILPDDVAVIRTGTPL